MGASVMGHWLWAVAKTFVFAYCTVWEAFSLRSTHNHFCFSSFFIEIRLKSGSAYRIVTVFLILRSSRYTSLTCHLYSVDAMGSTLCCGAMCTAGKTLLAVL